MQRQLTIEYGDEILAGLGLSPEQFSEEARFLLSVKLFELGKITSGQAANLCNLDRLSFLLMLPKAGVTTSNLDVEDASTELEFGRNA